MEELLHTEHDLRDQNAAVDRHVTSLKGRILKLRHKQADLEGRKKKVGEAMSWESRQKESRKKELQRAKAELEAKRQQIIVLGEEAEKMRAGIREMQDNLKSMNRKRLEVQDKYLHPSLRDIFVNEGTRGGPLSEHLVNKTVESIIPELEIGMHGIEDVEYRLHHSSPIASVFTLFCIYALAVSLVVTCLRYLVIAHRIMTLRRMLFMADMCFLAMWFLICVCYAAILVDPLEAMAREHGALAMVVQVLIMAGLLGNVVLRCLALCASVSAQTFIELVAIVYVAQHYYEAVWVRIVMDEGVKARLLSYVTYAIINGSLAIHRARSVSRAIQTAHEELRGTTAGKWDQSWFKTQLEKGIQYIENALTIGIPSTAADIECVAEAPRETHWPQRSTCRRAESPRTRFRPYYYE